MKRFSRRSGVALAVVLGVGTLSTGPSGAQDLQVQRLHKIVPLNGALALRAIMNCPGATANATLTLAAAATGVEQTSPNGAYGSDTCNRYVVDVNVPSASTPLPGVQETFGLWGKDFSDSYSDTSISQQECSSAHVDVTFYKKANGAATFVQIGGGRFNTRWVVPGQGFGQSGCLMSPGPNFQDPGTLNRPNAGTDTYRIAVRSYTSASLRKVKAGATRTPTPPG